MRGLFKLLLLPCDNLTSQLGLVELNVNSPFTFNGHLPATPEHFPVDLMEGSLQPGPIYFTVVSRSVFLIMTGVNTASDL